MCGILATLHGNITEEMLHKLYHRGPDQWGFREEKNATLAHTRLAIVSPGSQSQPLESENWILTINGEIYNAPRKEDKTATLDLRLDA